MNGCEHCNGSGWIATCACTPGSSVNYSECPHDPVPCLVCNRAAVVCPHAPEPCDECVDRDRAELVEFLAQRFGITVAGYQRRIREEAVPPVVDGPMKGTVPAAVWLDEDERHDVWGSRGIGTRDEMEAEGFLW